MGTLDWQFRCAPCQSVTHVVICSITHYDLVINMITPEAGIFSLIVTSIIALIVAVVLGRYRHLCRIMETKTGIDGIMPPWNIPPIWRKKWFRILSWLIVAITSIWFAGVVGLLIEVLVNKWLGRFSFGALLVARWQLSAFMATIQAEKMIPGIMDDNYPLTKEEVERLDKEYEEELKKIEGIEETDSSTAE